MGRLKNKKTIPTFNRPRLEIGTKVDRIWKNVKGSDIQEEDIVAGMGLVQAVSYMYDTHEVMVTAGEPVRGFFLDKDDIVYAFVRKDN